jgi:hypothetical protein
LPSWTARAVPRRWWREALATYGRRRATFLALTIGGIAALAIALVVAISVL